MFLGHALTPLLLLSVVSDEPRRGSNATERSLRGVRLRSALKQELRDLHRAIEAKRLTQILLTAFREALKEEDEEEQRERAKERTANETGKPEEILEEETVEVFERVGRGKTEPFQENQPQTHKTGNESCDNQTREEREKVEHIDEVQKEVARVKKTEQEKAGKRFRDSGKQKEKLEPLGRERKGTLETEERSVKVETVEEMVNVKTTEHEVKRAAAKTKRKERLSKDTRRKEKGAKERTSQIKHKREQKQAEKMVQTKKKLAEAKEQIKPDKRNKTRGETEDGSAEEQMTKDKREAEGTVKAEDVVEFGTKKEKEERDVKDEREKETEEKKRYEKSEKERSSKLRKVAEESDATVQVEKRQMEANPLEKKNINAEKDQEKDQMRPKRGNEEWKRQAEQGKVQTEEEREKKEQTEEVSDVKVEAGKRQAKDKVQKHKETKEEDRGQTEERLEREKQEKKETTKIDQAKSKLNEDERSVEAEKEEMVHETNKTVFALASGIEQKPLPKLERFEEERTVTEDADQTQMEKVERELSAKENAPESAFKAGQKMIEKGQNKQNKTEFEKEAMDSKKKPSEKLKKRDQTEDERLLKEKLEQERVEKPQTAAEVKANIEAETIYQQKRTDTTMKERFESEKRVEIERETAKEQTPKLPIAKVSRLEQDKRDGIARELVERQQKVQREGLDQEQIQNITISKENAKMEQEIRANLTQKQPSEKAKLAEEQATNMDVLEVIDGTKTLILGRDKIKNKKEAEKERVERELLAKNLSQTVEKDGTGLHQNKTVEAASTVMAVNVLEQQNTTVTKRKRQESERSAKENSEVEPASEKTIQKPEFEDQSTTKLRISEEQTGQNIMNPTKRDGQEEKQMFKMIVEEKRELNAEKDHEKADILGRSKEAVAKRTMIKTVEGQERAIQEQNATKSEQTKAAKKPVAPGHAVKKVEELAQMGTKEKLRNDQTEPQVLKVQSEKDKGEQPGKALLKIVGQEEVLKVQNVTLVNLEKKTIQQEKVVKSQQTDKEQTKATVSGQAGMVQKMESLEQLKEKGIKLTKDQIQREITLNLQQTNKAIPRLTKNVVSKEHIVKDQGTADILVETKTTVANAPMVKKIAVQEDLVKERDATRQNRTKDQIQQEKTVKLPETKTVQTNKAIPGLTKNVVSKEHIVKDQGTADILVETKTTVAKAPMVKKIVVQEELVKEQDATRQNRTKDQIQQGKAVNLQQTKTVQTNKAIPGLTKNVVSTEQIAKKIVGLDQGTADFLGKSKTTVAKSPEVKKNVAPEPLVTRRNVTKPENEHVLQEKAVKLQQAKVEVAPGQEKVVKIQADYSNLNTLNNKKNVASKVLTKPKSELGSGVVAKGETVKKIVGRETETKPKSSTSLRKENEGLTVKKTVGQEQEVSRQNGTDTKRVFGEVVMEKAAISDGREKETSNNDKLIKTATQHERVVKVHSESKLAPKDDVKKETVEQRAVKLHQLDDTKLTQKDTGKGQQVKQTMVGQEGKQSVQTGKAEKQVNDKRHVKMTATGQNVQKIVGQERGVEKTQDQRERLKLNAVKKDVAEEQNTKTLRVGIATGQETKRVNKAKMEQTGHERMVTGREAEKERQTAAILAQTNKLIAKEQMAKKIVGQEPMVKIQQAPKDQTNVILKQLGKVTVNDEMVGQNNPVNKAKIEQGLKGQEAAKEQEKENVLGQAKPVVSKEQMVKKIAGQGQVAKVHRAGEDQTKADVLKPAEAVGQNKRNATKPVSEAKMEHVLTEQEAAKEREQMVKKIAGQGQEAKEENGTKPNNQEETVKFQRAKTEQRKASILGNGEGTVGKGKEVTIQSKAQQTEKERVAGETAKQTMGQERRVNAQAGEEPAKAAILKRVKVK